MVSPSYTTDLSDITTIESGDTFVEMTGYALGDNAVIEADWFIQGATCASDEANSKTGVGHSIGYDYGSQITFAAGDCFFGWMQCMAGNAMDTFANGGYRVLIGSTIGDYDGWAVGGRDFGRNPYGGWVNVVVDPTATADYTLGTSTGYQLFAVAFNLTSSIGKGRPNNADAYRYGRGELIIEYGDVSNGYGLFSGIAIQNDGTDSKWGLLQAEGIGYLWKGLMSFGNVTNVCDFRDSNVNITVDNTPKTYAAFNKIEINNASSRVDWTGVNIAALSSTQLSLGSLEVVDNADINIDTCIFTDMSTFIFQSNSTLLTTTFRRCGLVTQGSSILTGCIFDKSTGTVGITVNALNSITDCTFISDGTGHGIDLGTISTTQSLSWDNNDSGYTASSSGNETILVSVASGETLTINVGSGYTTPSVYNTDTGTVSVVSGQVTTKVTVKELDGGALIAGARVLIWVTDATNFPYIATVTITGSGTTATVTHTAHGLATSDNVIIEGAVQDYYNGAYAITVTDVNTYTYTTNETLAITVATGTIVSTFAFINDVTDALGVIEDTRTVSSDQPIAGRIRKSSTSPFYKQGTISDTVDNATGFSATVQLASDE